jgi:hypothetical protein
MKGKDTKLVESLKVLKSESQKERPACNLQATPSTPLLRRARARSPQLQELRTKRSANPEPRTKAQREPRTKAQRDLQPATPSHQTKKLSLNLAFNTNR